jgi:hypothetical protein
MKFKRNRGSVTVELPFVLWFLFVLILFPMLNLGTICLRSYFLFQSCHNAALTAAKAKSFETTSGTDLSAKDAATQVANGIASKWQGVRINSISTQIVQTKISDHTETVFSAKMPTPPDVNANTYQIRVTVTGETDPLLTFNLAFFGAIPGLTGPMVMTMNDQNFVENTQGLTR